MHNQPISDAEMKFLTRFWPSASMHTASDPLWIVAGNKNQFDNFVIRKRAMGYNFDFRYVSSPDVLRGVQRIRGFYIGNYQERNDWPEIDAFIKMIKARGG